MKKFLFIISTILLLSISAFAQYFGGFSSSINWREIDTPHIRLIFPAPMQQQAQRVATEIEFFIAQEQLKNPTKLRKINVILNNQGVVSNGYVASVPYHSLFYTQAPQDANMLGTQNWLTSLAVHEYRHVWQHNQMFSAWGKAFYFLWGDQGWGAFTSLIFPNWYFEGDAVLNETRYSRSGRGRLPFFSLQSRAMALDSVWPSYKQVRNGSYNFELPNHYEFGYNLLAYGEKKYGSSFWSTVVNDASRLKGFTFSFAKAVEKNARLSLGGFYDSMLVDFNRHARQRAEARDVTVSKTISKNSKTVTNYYQATYETDSTLFVLKDSYKSLLAIYKIDLKLGKEYEIVELGYLDDIRFSYAHGLLLWAERKHAVRRWNTEYSELKVLNLKTREIRTLGQNSRYFSACIHPQKNEAVLVSCSQNQEYELNVISLINGRILLAPEELRFKLGETVSTPVYSENGNSIIYILNKDSKLALFEYNFDTKQTTQLLPYTSHAITNPLVKGSRVYFSASFDGQDDIYFVDRLSKHVNRVVSSRVGAYAPTLSPSSSQMVFSNYTSNGFKLQQIFLSDTLMSNTKIFEPNQTDYYASPIFEKDSVVLESIPQVQYPVKAYNKILHALNLHSWGPVHNSSDVSGLELRSNNILNDFDLGAGLYYSNADKLSYTGIDVSYAGFYPVYGVSYLYAKDSEFKLHVVDASVGFPFDFSTPKYSKSFSLKAGVIQQQYNFFADSYAFDGTQAQIGLSCYKYPARLQVASRLGFSFDFSIKDGFVNDKFDAGESVFNAQLFFPGLLNTHATLFKYATKSQNVDGFFQDGMSYARGFNRPDSAFVNYNLYSVNYQLPLCYPNIGINGFFFLKRIRLNLFADFAAVNLYNADRYDSVCYGVETYFDVNWFNLVELPVYFRYVRLKNASQAQVFELGANVVSF